MNDLCDQLLVKLDVLRKQYEEMRAQLQDAESALTICARNKSPAAMGYFEKWGEK